jgi:hypothetical protein
MCVNVPVPGGMSYMYMRVIPKLDAGYKWLEPGERIKDGDEVIRFDKWSNAWAVGDIVSDESRYVYRRKLEEVAPGVGYRWVEKGELLEPSDEFHQGGNPKYVPLASNLVYTICTCNGWWRRKKKDKALVSLPDTYVWVREGQVLKAGDQYLLENGAWWVVNLEGQKCQRAYAFRRQVVCGAEYRFLQKDETIPVGAEVYDEGEDKWIPSIAAGCQVNSACRYRVKLNNPESNGITLKAGGYYKIARDRHNSDAKARGPARWFDGGEFGNEGYWVVAGYHYLTNGRHKYNEPEFHIVAEMPDPNAPKPQGECDKLRAELADLKAQVEQLKAQKPKDTQGCDLGWYWVEPGTALMENDELRMGGRWVKTADAPRVLHSSEKYIYRRRLN